MLTERSAAAVTASEFCVHSLPAADCSALTATVTLQKGLNYVRLTAKGDYVRAEFLEVAYSGKEKAELAKTASFNAVDAQVIDFVSTNGEEQAGLNGIITGASYLGKL